MCYLDTVTAPTPRRRIIGPQPGFQTRFMSTAVDIAIGGGAAGGGKSWALVNAPLAYAPREGFQWAFFRTHYNQLTGPGSVWEEARKSYPLLGGKSTGSPLAWRFPTPGVMCTFNHMQRDDTAEQHKSKAYGYIGIDEATTMSEFNFWYLWSRCRGLSGVRGFMRATTNPDPDSHLRKFIDWYINCDGYVHPDRAGVPRYFVRVGDTLHQSDDRIALEHTHRKTAQSFTYIPGFVQENAALLAGDDSYLAKLDNLPRVERERLLLGNWDTKVRSGDYFNRSWFPLWDESLPIDRLRLKTVRAWDLAATPYPGDEVIGHDGKPLEGAAERAPGAKEPDWTRGVKVSRLQRGEAVDFVLEDMRSARDRGSAILWYIIETAKHDGKGCTVVIPQDPAQAGKDQAERWQKEIKRAGFRCEVLPVSNTGKEAWASRPSEHAMKRRVAYRGNGPWVQTFFNEAEAFPEGDRSPDCVDAFSMAFRALGDSQPALDLDPRKLRVPLQSESPRGDRPLISERGFSHDRGMY